MGLLDKLKNVLFEEEEIEEVKDEIKKDNEVSKSTMELPKINRKPKKEKYDYEEETDKELFKIEKTFDFPIFDEEEFEDLVPKKKENTVLKPYDSESNIKEEKKDIVEYKENRENDLYDQSRKKDYRSTRIVRNIPTEQPKKIFKPSPVISPVYGILDKNYKKEDVLTKDEAVEKKNITLDVDSVRKKAFGTLEEDLVTNLSDPIEKKYEEEKIIENDEISTVEEVNEELENLLEDTVDIEIDVTKEMEIPSRVSKYDEVNEELEDSIEEVPEEVSVEEVSEDTLENDLFDLIDSMYDNREDEE